jgi:hypothetical protein
MKHLLLIIFAFFLISNIEAQTSGDYRSIASGNWSALATWERFDGVSWQAALVAPAYTDGVITVRNPDVVTINSSTTVDQLTIDAGAKLVISAATTVSAGTGTDLTINGTLDLAAALAGAGTTDMNGVMNWTGGTVTSPVTIAAAGIVNVSGAIAKALNSTMVNNGTINWSGSNIDFNGGSLTNNGVIDNSSDATLSNTSFTNSLTNTGTFRKSGGTGTGSIIAIPMTNSGTIQVNSGLLIKNTNLLTNSGPINTASGAEFRTNSAFTINSGTSFTGNGTVGLGSTVTNNIAMNIPATVLFSQLAGSAITGTGSFTINGTMSWTGGNMGVVLNILSGSVLNMSSTNTKTLSNTLTNDGTINWLGGNVNFVNGRLNNNSTMDVKFDNSMSNFGGVNLFVNTGTIIKSAGTNTSSIILPLNNTGTITVNSGTLISGGVTNLNSGTVLSGTGTFGIDGTVNVNIPMSTPSSLTIRKASGTTVGTETFTISGVMNWLGGTLGSPFTILSGATLSMATGSRTLSTTLTNNGIINWSAGAIDFTNGTLINTATFNNSFDGSINNVSGSNLFNNSGTFTKLAGVLTNSTIGVPAVNSGTINVNAGVLVNSGSSFMNTGVINIGSGKTFSNTGTLMLQSGSTITGTGSLSLAGVTQFTTDIPLPTGMTMSVLTGCTTFGAGICTASNTVNWSGGTIGSPFVLTASSTLNASASAKSLNSTLTSNGSMLWTGGDISFNNGTLVNNGSIDQSFDGMMDAAAGTNLFTNTGTFSKSGGSGTSAINIPSTNSGTINGGNTIAFNSSFSNTGTISPGRPIGILSVSSAVSPLLTSTSTLHIDLLNGTGAGSGHDQLSLNQNLVLDGTLTVTESGTIPAGTYTIINLTSGSISGNFTTVIKPAAYTLTISGTTVILSKLTLPLNWISFTGRRSGDKVILNWITESQRDNHSFDVERSSNGRTFEKIGMVASKDGNDRQQYAFEDLQFNTGTNYYRLKQTDVDGKFEYSKTVVVKSDNETAVPVKMFPNPAKGSTTVIVPQEFLAGDIYVRTLSGQVVKAFTNVTVRTIPLQLPKGNYFIQFKNGNHSVVEKLIIE